MADTRYEIIVQTIKLESDAIDTNICKYFTKHVKYANSSNVTITTAGVINSGLIVNFNSANFGRYLGVKTSAPGFSLVGAFYPVPGETYTLQYSLNTPNTREIYFWFGQSNDSGPADITLPAGSTEGVFTFTWGASIIGEWYLKIGTGTNMTTNLTLQIGNTFCPGPTETEFVPSGDKILKYLDTYKYEPVDLTYNVADIQDISKRNSSFSRTITLPETKNNRQVFANISNLASDASFDPNLKAKAWILVDTVVVFEGNLQLKNIKLNDSLESQYEVVIYADNDTFFSNLGEKYLEDLDFTSVNHVWNRDNIYNSWFGDWKLGYFYPLIDYGQGWVYTSVSSGTNYDKQLNTQEFFPATYVKTIWNKIFLEAGYEWTSTFLNTPEFENLLIPFNGKTMANGDDFAEDKIFRVAFDGDILPIAQNDFEWLNTLPNPVEGQIRDTSAWFGYLRFQDWGVWQNLEPTNESSPNGDPNGLWNTTDFTYINYYNAIAQQFKFDFNLELNIGSPAFTEATVIVCAFREFNPDGTPNADWASDWGYLINDISFGDSIVVNVYKDTGDLDNTILFSDNIIGTVLNNTLNNVQVNIKYTMPLLNDLTYTTGRAPLYEGERVRFKTLMLWGINGGSHPWTIKTDSYIFNDVDAAVYPNALFDFSGQLPKKVKQKDFVSSLIKMFNLYIEPSKERANTLIVEPRDIYYASGVVKDWTNKIDLNIDISEQILADTQNKQILFTYKDDKDYLNQYYKNAYQEIYGQYLYTSGNEFTKSVQTIQPIFAATPISAIPDSGNSIIIPRIIKDGGPGPNAQYMESIDHTVRILQRGSFNQFYEDGNYNFDFTIIANGIEGQDYIDITATSAQVTEYLSVGNIVLPEDIGDRYEIVSVTNLGGTSRRVFIFPTLSNIVNSSSILKVKVPVNSGLISISQPSKKIVFDGLDLTSGLDFVYPYVGHYDNPYQPTNDINFGQLREEMYLTSYTTANNLVNTYWLQFLEETTGRDSRIITVQMYLTPVDIQNFKFSDSIYLFFNGNGHYYRVNKISGYDPGQIKTCTVELIRAQEKPIIKQLKGRVSKLESIKDGLATNVLLPNGWNPLGPAGGGSGNSPGDVISSGYVGTGIKNTVKGDNEIVNGNHNIVLGDKIVVTGDRNNIERRSQNVLINGDDNLNSNPGRSTFINGASNSIYRQNDCISINGDENILLIEQLKTICGTATVCEDACILRTSGINSINPLLRKIYLSEVSGPWLDPCSTYNDIATDLYYINVYDCSDNLLDVIQIGPESEVNCAGDPQSGTFIYYNEDADLLDGACYFTYCENGTVIYDRNVTVENAFPGGTTVSIPDSYDPGNIGDLIGKTLTLASDSIPALVNFVTIDGVTNNLDGTYTLNFSPALTFTFSSSSFYNINTLNNPDDLNRYWCLQGDYTQADGGSITLIQGGVTYSGSMLVNGFTNSITSVEIIDTVTGEPITIPGEVGATSSFCVTYPLGPGINKDIIINGDRNFIHGSSSNLNIFGNDNDIGTMSKDISVFGNNNYIIDNLSDVFVIGNNITVTQSGAKVIGDGFVADGDFSVGGDLEIGEGKAIYSYGPPFNFAGPQNWLMLDDSGGNVRFVAANNSNSQITILTSNGGRVEIGILGGCTIVQSAIFKGGFRPTITPGSTGQVIALDYTSPSYPLVFKVTYVVNDSTLNLSMSKEDSVQLSFDGTNWVVDDQVNIFELQTNPVTPITSVLNISSVGTLIRFRVTNNEANDISVKMSLQGL